MWLCLHLIFSVWCLSIISKCNSKKCFFYYLLIFIFVIPPNGCDRCSIGD